MGGFVGGGGGGGGGGTLQDRVASRNSTVKLGIFSVTLATEKTPCSPLSGNAGPSRSLEPSFCVHKACELKKVITGCRWVLSVSIKAAALLWPVAGSVRMQRKEDPVHLMMTITGSESKSVSVL